MTASRILTVVALTALLSLTAASVFAGPLEGGNHPPPFRMGMSGVCADNNHMYVMAGGKIMVYDLSDMSLLKSVDLPEAVPPAIVPPIDAKRGEFHHHPPHGGGPHGLWTSGGFLYVLAGPVVYRYTVSDMKLQDTVELPEPDFPPPPK